ncbi:MAG TPA: hypothetical protein VLA89_11560 [Gemmatimonadales bacterium]|nr:hypothetical protein [Gemmatimonadales bacterium]
MVTDQRAELDDLTDDELDAQLGEGVIEQVTEEEEAEVAKMLPVARPVGPMPDAGTMALASLSDEDFDTRLAMLKAGRVRIARIQRELLKPGVDYGEIGNMAKPTLLKPGAEKLCDFYRFAADFSPVVNHGDGQTTPEIEVLTRCQLHLGSLDGPIVAVGYGQANSWEKRYRYRSGGKPCPECGNIGSLTGKPTSQGSHWCIPDKGGCNANISADRYATLQKVDQVENPDPYELANTLVKMAEKRAHVDATLRATATSGLFTQDEDEKVQPRNNVRKSEQTASRSSGERQPVEGMDSDEGLPEIGGDAGECPVHHKPWSLKTSAKGDFWSCGTKDGDKWCPERPTPAWVAAHEVEA